MNAIDSQLDFDWRSCEWTYCGASADAQEALDALDHLLGAHEPFDAKDNFGKYRNHKQGCNHKMIFFNFYHL
jgi:hypothetical protein